jgi:hypothetical protein
MKNNRSSKLGLHWNGGLGLLPRLSRCCRGLGAGVLLLLGCGDHPHAAVPVGESVLQSGNPLNDTTILIIRHAEKPQSGTGLSSEGQARAEAYVKYFQTFRVGSEPIHLDYLVAADDSEHSQRSRLTLEPLAHAIGLKPDLRFQAKRPQDLVRELQSQAHGKNILICWHHREIPDLLRELGADPERLLPFGEWPPQQFGWVLELRYDREGHVIRNKTKRIKENLALGD